MMIISGFINIPFAILAFYTFVTQRPEVLETWNHHFPIGKTMKKSCLGNDCGRAAGIAILIPLHLNLLISTTSNELLKFLNFSPESKERSFNGVEILHLPSGNAETV